jgi:hypothetical protein
MENLHKKESEKIDMNQNAYLLSLNFHERLYLSNSGQHTILNLHNNHINNKNTHQLANRLPSLSSAHYQQENTKKLVSFMPQPQPQPKMQIPQQQRPWESLQPQQQHFRYTDPIRSYTQIDQIKERILAENKVNLEHALQNQQQNKPQQQLAPKMNPNEVTSFISYKIYINKLMSIKFFKKLNLGPTES